MAPARFQHFNRAQRAAQQEYPSGYSREEAGTGKFLHLHKRMAAAKSAGYRSVPEHELGKLIGAAAIRAEYEPVKLPYVLERHYTPDFRIGDLLVEVKGWWSPTDRAKYLAVVQQNPDLQFLVLLIRPGQKIQPRSKTTLWKWCEQNGLDWAPYPKTQEQLLQCLAQRAPDHRSSAPTSDAPGVTRQMGQPSDMTGASTASSARRPGSPTGSPDP